MSRFTSNGPPDHSPWVRTHPAGMRHPWEGSPSAADHRAGRHCRKGRAAEGSHGGKGPHNRGEGSRPSGGGAATDILSRDRRSSRAAVGDAPGSSHGSRPGMGRGGGCSPEVGRVDRTRRRAACTDVGPGNGTGGDLSLAYPAGSALDIRTRSTSWALGIKGSRGT